MNWLNYLSSVKLTIVLLVLIESSIIVKQLGIKQ